MEQWKDIAGYEDSYEVSDMGRVRSKQRKSWNGYADVMLPSRILKPNTLAKGYLQVTLYRDGQRRSLQVHRLVAEAFVAKNDGCNQVNHLNGNKQDNRAGNLEWTDNSGNQLHAWATGLQQPHYCGGGADMKRRIAMYDMQGRFEQEFPSIHAAARAIGCKWPSCISAVLSNRPNKRRCKSYKGHRFEYID